MVCYNNSKCNSKLRILRAASVHFAVLRTFLSAMYKARNGHMRVSQINEALCSGNLRALMVLSDLENFDALLSNSVDSAFEPESVSNHDDCTFRKPNLESELLYTNAELIAKYKKKLNDYPDHACCSCEQLHYLKNVTTVIFGDKLGATVWPALKKYLLEVRADAAKVSHYMCNYCKSAIKHNLMPLRCVLNGLQWLPCHLNCKSWTL